MKKMLILFVLLFQITKTPEVLSPSDVVIGMEGFGLSSFQDSKIDTFKVKITGKLPTSPTGKTIFLAELKGDVVDEAGVLSGMSGSPVYIDGKLLGAVAYAWAFSKKPICGIVPFEDMKSDGSSSYGDAKGLTPIAPVLNVAGFHSDAIFLLDSLPGNFHLTSGQISGKGMQSTPIVPGGVCGVVLVTGDGSISMMGTITAVIGDTIYAFGHPAFGTGVSSLPLSEGGVSGYLPSYYSSFKFSNPGNIIGTVVLDGFSSIKAIRGKVPPMVGCRIKLNDREREYRITAMRNLSSDLVGFLIYTNWLEEMGTYSPATIKGRLNLYTNQGNVSISSAMSGHYLYRDIYGWVRGLLLDIQTNRYMGIEVDSIMVDMDVEKEIREYSIKEIRLKKTEFKLGETINVSIIIDQYRQPDTTISVSLSIPDEPCDLMLNVSGSLEYLNYESNRIPEKFQFDDFQEWREFINSLPPNDRVIILLYKKGKSIGVGNLELKDLPFSLQKLLNKDSNVSGNKFFPIERKEILLDGPVSGESTQRVLIRR